MKLVFIFISLLVVSCSKKDLAGKSKDNKNDVIVAHLRDKLVVKKVLSSNIAGESLGNCRKHISKIVCLIDADNKRISSSDEIESKLRQPCLPGGERYIKHFTNHFDNSEPMLQKMYCSLSKIWVEKNTISTAYATPIYHKGELISAAIGIRKEFLDSPLNFERFLNWKEETSFGGTASISKAETGASLNLIKYHASNPSKKVLIEYVINHEFAHLLDFGNVVNAFKDCEDGICKPLEGSWAEFSWENNEKPLYENDYPLRLKLCYYFCDGKFLDKSLTFELFDSLEKTNFHTLYSSFSPYEDFAEVFSFYLLTKKYDFKLSAATPKIKIHIDEKFKSEKMGAKNEFVKDFISTWEHLSYPGLANKSIIADMPQLLEAEGDSKENAQEKNESEESEGFIPSRR